MTDLDILSTVVQAASQPYAEGFMGRLYRERRATYRHSVHVAGISVQLGDEYGLSGKRLYDLAAGALLHDIGKLKIPKEVLYKHGSLSDENYKLVCMHPLYSYDLLLSRGEGHPYIIDLICLMHHIKLDFSGYPSKGSFPVSVDSSRIPVEAQIVAVADMYDAMVSPRPYKEAYPGIFAIGELFKDATEGRLNMRVVTCLQQLVQENKIIF